MLQLCNVYLAISVHSMIAAVETTALAPLLQRHQMHERAFEQYHRMLSTFIDGWDWSLGLVHSTLATALGLHGRCCTALHVIAACSSAADPALAAVFSIRFEPRGSLHALPMPAAAGGAAMCTSWQNRAGACIGNTSRTVVVVHACIVDSRLPFWCLCYDAVCLCAGIWHACCGLPPATHVVLGPTYSFMLHSKCRQTRDLILAAPMI